MQIDDAMFLLIIRSTPEWIYKYPEAELQSIEEHYAQVNHHGIQRLCVAMPGNYPDVRTRTYYIELRDNEFQIHYDGPMGQRKPLGIIPTCDPNFDHIVWHVLVAIWMRDTNGKPPSAVAGDSEHGLCCGEWP